MVTGHSGDEKTLAWVGGWAWLGVIQTESSNIMQTTRGLWLAENQLCINITVLDCTLNTIPLPLIDIKTRIAFNVNPAYTATDRSALYQLLLYRNTTIFDSFVFSINK